jgi:magnesium transporter
MMTCRVYRSGMLVEERVGPEDLAARLEQADARIWVDVVDATDEELDELQERFKLHPLSIEDAKHRGQRPKVEFFPDYLFVVVHGLSLDDDRSLVDREVHAFAGAGWLVTLRAEPLFDFGPVVERWDRQPELTAEGAGFFLYILLDEIVDDYLNVVERFEDLSDEIEDRVFRADVESDVQQQIFLLKRQVVAFRRLVMPVREVIDLVHEQPGLVTPALAPYYRDVLDHVLRAIEFTNNIRELLTSALEVQLTQVSNRLNIIIKKLTSWAAIVLVPTLIAGIYGMNFRHMPELDWVLGYPFAIGLMVASALVLRWAFKRKDWL